MLVNGEQENIKLDVQQAVEHQNIQHNELALQVEAMRQHHEAGDGGGVNNDPGSTKNTTTQSSKHDCVKRIGHSTIAFFQLEQLGTTWLFLSLRRHLRRGGDGRHEVQL